MRFATAVLTVATLLPGAPGPGTTAHAETRTAPAALDTGGFPEPEALRARVRFWMDIYTRYTTRQAVIHDAEEPEIVYGVIDLGGDPVSGEAPFPEGDSDILEAARDRVRATIVSLDAAAPPAVDPASPEALVRTALAGHLEPGQWRAAADRVRSQRGQADRFRAGLVRSGAYIESFRALARETGVPEDLAFLPHVESSFAGAARSHAGAAGMWQFMRSTGRLYLKIDSTRDERMDPWLAARAAFLHLRSIYEDLGSWPLALTAYNHGLGGMQRARRTVGDDIAAIIDAYTSRTFGFASRNFYAEFLAARRIAMDPEAYFGRFELLPPIAFDAFVVPGHALAPALAAALGLDLAELERLNPALELRVWRGGAPIPRGYSLRLPRGEQDRVAEAWSKLPAGVRVARASLSSGWHTVRKGDSLSSVARQHGTTVNALVRLNGISARTTIYPGQRLRTRQTEEWAAVQAPQESGFSRTVADLIRHVVRKGETISSIALRYGIQVSRIVQANGLKDASIIRAGQVLVIPAAR